jgi:hypothetical protein
LFNIASQLADAIPLHGSTLPFNLREIARKVNGAIYFAPRRFTAVQLAFDQPRSRTLLFHTGRIVGTGTNPCTTPHHPPRVVSIPPLVCTCTGTNGPQAARLAVARAIHAIATQAGVHIGIRRFSVINQVREKGLVCVCGHPLLLFANLPFPRSEPLPSAPIWTATSLQTLIPRTLTLTRARLSDSRYDTSGSNRVPRRTMAMADLTACFLCVYRSGAPPARRSAPKLTAPEK